MTLNKKAMKVGDIILVHSGKSLLSKGIKVFMDEELEKHNAILPYPTPTHAGTIVEYKNELRVAEAVKEGYVVTPLLKAYSKQEWKSRIVLMSSVYPYTAEEQKKVSEYAIEMSLHGTPYDVPNFIFQMILVKTGLWIGPKGDKAKMKVYCSESTAMCENLIHPSVFPKPYLINPVMIALEPTLYIDSIGVEL